jgi:hypothetical protein
VRIPNLRGGETRCISTCSFQSAHGSPRDRCLIHRMSRKTPPSLQAPGPRLFSALRRVRSVRDGCAYRSSGKRSVFPPFLAQRPSMLLYACNGWDLDAGPCCDGSGPISGITMIL